MFKDFIHFIDWWLCRSHSATQPLCQSGWCSHSATLPEWLEQPLSHSATGAATLPEWPDAATQPLSHSATVAARVTGAATQPLCQRVAGATQPLSHSARVAGAATQPLSHSEWLSGWSEPRQPLSHSARVADVKISAIARSIKQSNCAQMSLDLHFGCRPFPWCGGLVHLRLAGKASAKLRQPFWLAKRWASCINRWHVSKLQLNAAGIHAKMSFICHSLPFLASSVWAARGLSKLLAANGDMSSKQPTASELVGNK